MHRVKHDLRCAASAIPRATALLVALLALAGCLGSARAQTVAGLAYAQVDGATLRMDLYLPSGATSPVPVVVWVHGGGWCAGARAPLPTHAAALPAQGVAVAAVSYRLTSTTPDCANGNGATWPAPIHDLKGAVRFLRANAATWGLDASRIGAWGQSAGAHLATTLALSAGDAALEGTVGGNAGFSSAVAAVVAYFPPTDLLQLGPDFALAPPNLPSAVAVVDGPGQPHARLLGFGAPGEGVGLIRANLANPAPPWPMRVARALSASPVTWVDGGDVPVYLLHGMADTTVPLNQARRLRDALASFGVAHVHREIAGLGHVPPSDAESTTARAWLVAQLAATPDALFGDGFESP
jgi:acetyl esterase/lipase